MLSLIKNNFGLKVLSVALALVAWTYVHITSPGNAAARLDQTLTIPIVATGLPPGEQVRYADRTATLVVELQHGAAVKADQVQAVVDLSDLAPGFHNVPVKVVGPDLAIRSLSPASVTLRVDRVEDRTVPVTIDYAGGRTGVVVESAQVTPQMETIRGVDTDVARVDAVRVTIPLPAKPERFDAMIRPDPVDAHGAVVGGLGVSPNLVRVRARFVAPGAAPQK